MPWRVRYMRPVGDGRHQIIQNYGEGSLWQRMPHEDTRHGVDGSHLCQNMMYFAHEQQELVQLVAINPQLGLGTGGGIAGRTQRWKEWFSKHLAPPKGNSLTVVPGRWQRRIRLQIFRSLIRRLLPP
jgi:hypothetical protein